MLAGSHSVDVHQVKTVASALYARGSVHESVALIRGARAREPGERAYDELLETMLAGRPIERSPTVELDLSLVDGWIRQGMLVEALALLGGTTLGTAETGQEWANLLGELLAPVPVDAEDTLVQMHTQLLSGGAAVALTLLEDRAKGEPRLPAWATRRLELLRWMLLDNAKAVERDEAPYGDAPTELARCIREPLGRRNIRAAAKAAEAFAAMHPESADARRVAEAFANLIAEIESQAEQAKEQTRTIPMYGPPAAAMQLRMGNLAVAGQVYERLIDENPEMDGLRLLLADVNAVLAAVDGRPVSDELLGENTMQVALPDGDRDEPALVLDLSDDDLPEDLVIPNTSVTETPERRAQRAAEAAVDAENTIPHPPEPPPREESGLVAVKNDYEDGPTLQTPSVDTSAAELEAQGRFGEAEQLYRALSGADPTNTRWRESAARCRKLRLGAAVGDASDVLVRQIVRIK